MAASKALTEEHLVVLKDRALAEVEKYLAADHVWSTVREESAGVTYKSCRHPGHGMDVFYWGKKIQVSLQTLQDYLWASTKESVQEFDPDTLEWEFRTVGEFRVISQLSKLGWPIWNRSFVTAWFVHRASEQRVIMLYFSVADPEYPEKPKDNVRGTVTFMGEALTQQADGSALFERVMHVDPAGNLPAALVNRLAGREVIGFLNHVEKKLVHWEKTRKEKS